MCRSYHDVLIIPQDQNMSWGTSGSGNRENMQVHGNGYILTVFSGNTKITGRGTLLLVFLW